MATLKTQYNNFLLDNPNSALTFEEWVEWRFSNIELPPSEGLRPLDEYEEELGHWDVTLIDGLEEEPPYVSDDFQIGPDGAYEHSDRELDFQKTLKSISQMLMIVKYNNGDISDIGNEIGIAIGKSIENIKDHEISEFIFGIKHGISLTNNTH